MPQNTKQSVIKHPEKSPLVLLRSEYLEITGNHCAAKILAILEFWTNKLQQMGNTLSKAREWIYKTLDALHNELMGEHGIHTIRKGISILEDKGFIKRRHNPHIKYDRTWQYKLEVENIQEALDELICESEQIDNTPQTDPSDEGEQSISQDCPSSIIENPLDNSSESKTQKAEVFLKTEERIPEQIKRMLPHIAAEWRIFPASRQAIREQLAMHGLDIITILESLGIVDHEH